MSASATQGSHN